MRDKRVPTSGKKKKGFVRGEGPGWGGDYPSTPRRNEGRREKKVRLI